MSRSIVGGMVLAAGLAGCVAAGGAEDSMASEPVVLGRRVSFPSEELGEEREILIRLPVEYNAGEERYPVLYVLDGEWHFLSVVAAVEILSECGYVQLHPVPPIIVVGLVNVDRTRDFTPTHVPGQHGMAFPTSGESERFLDYVESELIPFIDGAYRTQPYRIVCGWSLGGLLAVQALMERPEVFDAYVAVSPSLWWDDDLLVRRVRDLAEAGTVRERSLVMTIGTGEEGGLCYNAVQEFVKSIADRPIQGLEFARLEIPGETHNTTAFKAQFEGLRTLFADWDAPPEILDQGVDAVDAYYEALSVKYKQPLQTPERVFLSLLRHHLASGNWERCFAAGRSWVDRFPESPDARLALGEVYQRGGRADLARAVFEDAITSELGRDAPDSVFIDYVRGVLEELGTVPRRE